MQRRTRRSLNKFPTSPEVSADKVLRDTRNMDFMSKFRDYHVRTVFYLALLGMTDEQMAVVFDIPLHTFSSWKTKYPTFLESLKKGKEQADAAVVYSLYQAAIGYEHESEQIFMTKEKIFARDDKGHTYIQKEVPKVVRVPIVKRYPPSVKAALRWLELRQPAEWSERKDMTAHLNVTQNNFAIQGLSLDELKLLQKIGLQHAPIEDVAFSTTTQRELKTLTA